MCCIMWEFRAVFSEWRNLQLFRLYKMIYFHIELHIETVVQSKVKIDLKKALNLCSIQFSLAQSQIKISCIFFNWNFCIDTKASSYKRCSADRKKCPPDWWAGRPGFEAVEVNKVTGSHGIFLWRRNQGAKMKLF